MRLASPLHLHISLSASYTTSIVTRPPCTGECRFVRVIRVLDVSQTRADRKIGTLAGRAAADPGLAR